MAKRTALDWSKCAPDSGWMPRAYYVVEVKFNSANTKHRAILYTGFWDNRSNSPGNYSAVFNGSYEDGKTDPDELYFVRVISEIEDMRNV